MKNNSDIEFGNANEPLNDSLDRFSFVVTNGLVYCRSWNFQIQISAELKKEFCFKNWNGIKPKVVGIKGNNETTQPTSNYVISTLDSKTKKYPGSNLTPYRYCKRQ